MFKSIRNFFRVDQSNTGKLFVSTFRDKIIDSANATIKSVKIDGWSNILTGLGMRGRDKAVSGCFRACWNSTFIEQDQLYRADGLTRRIIDIVAAEMIRQGWDIEGDPEGSISGKMEELNANCKLSDLIKWARLYGGAIIVMGIVDGRQLDEPVNEFNIRSVDWLHVFDRWQLQVDPQGYCRDLNDCNYGNPDYYQVQDYRTGANFLVHHSRVLRMDWNLLPNRQQMINQGWGDSVITSIYEELRNYGTAFANASTIMQDFVNGVMKIPNLSQTLLNSCGDSDIIKRLEFANLSKGITSMLVLDGDETYEKLSTNVSGLSDLLDRFMLSISSVTGIPITLLFGQSPAGLTATGASDIRNFYDMVKQFQETKLKPVLEKLTRYLMIAKEGVFKGNEPENWNIKFVPLWQNTEEQEAIMRRTVAETDAIYIDRGVLDPNEVAISRFGGDRYSMNTIIDVEMRENRNNYQEIEDLENKKEEEIKIEESQAGIGDDYLGNPEPTAGYLAVDGE